MISAILIKDEIDVCMKSILSEDPNNMRLFSAILGKSAVFGILQLYSAKMN